MPYLITANSEEGAVSIQQDTAVAAMDKAIQLTNEGLRDILITDPAGQLYAPAEFQRLFLQDRD